MTNKPQKQFKTTIHDVEDKEDIVSQYMANIREE